jgi:hypothetical protein
MGIHFDNPINNSRLHPVSRVSTQTDPHIKGAGELGSFMEVLKKVSGDPELAIQQDLPKSPQEAMALCKRMELEMNESLLRIFSDTKGENSFENSLMNDPMELFSRGAKDASFLSTIRQDPSKNGLPMVRTPEQIIEKTGKTNTDSTGIHDLYKIIQKASMTYGVDAELIRGVIRAESDFDPNAISSKGAAGLMQLMPETAKELGVTDPFNPTENIMGGTRYLKKLLDRYDGNVPLALAAYNWGMGNMDSHRSQMPMETKNYVAKITGIALT